MPGVQPYTVLNHCKVENSGLKTQMNEWEKTLHLLLKAVVPPPTTRDDPPLPIA